MEDKNQTSASTGTGMGGTTPVPATSDVSEAVTSTNESSFVTSADTASTSIASEPVISVQPSNRSAVLKQYAIALLVVVVMAGGVTYVLIKQGRMNMPAVFAKVVELVHPAPPAAVVNGVKISMADYIKNKTQIEQSATQGGADLTKASVQAQIKTQALDVLINTEVLRQAAVKDGIKVTDDKVKARYDEIVKTLGDESKLAAKMTELGMTKDSLMKDISSEILIQDYLAKAVDTSSATVTPEEIKTAYDQANTNPAQKLPPLDKVSPQIEAQLKQTKQQDLITAYIQKLRAEAKIETNV